MTFQGAYTAGEESLVPFDFEIPASFLAANPNMSFDFTQTHTNSDLEVESIELDLNATVQVNASLWLYGGYRYLDYNDDAPYLYDTSGSVELFRFGLGWSR